MLRASVSPVVLSIGSGSPARGEADAGREIVGDNAAIARRACSGVCVPGGAWPRGVRGCRASVAEDPCVAMRLELAEADTASGEATSQDDTASGEGKSDITKTPGFERCVVVLKCLRDYNLLSYDQSPRVLTEREAHEAKHACSRGARDTRGWEK